MDQLTIKDYRKNLLINRYGKLEKIPEGVTYTPDPKRCELCKHWQILPVEEQPPEGWTVRGQCNCYHEEYMMKNGYWKTGSTSYCQDFEEA